MNDIEMVLVLTLIGTGVIIWVVGLIVVSLVDKHGPCGCPLFCKQPKHEELRAALDCEHCPFEKKCRIETRKKIINRG